MGCADGSRNSDCYALCMRGSLSAASLFLLVALLGCHSAYVDAVVHNRTDQTITLVEVDYPSASFGTQTLGPAQDFHYRFKVLGTGGLKLLYTDEGHREQHSDGPQLTEGDEGALAVTVSPGGVQWDAKVGKH